MSHWTTKKVHVHKVDFDHDLSQFRITDLDGNFLGTITPMDADNMQDIIDELDVGRCPVADAWEDGMGNVCTMEGWGGRIGEGDPLSIEGHPGTWIVIDQTIYNGKFVYLLESEDAGEDTAYMIVDRELHVLANDCPNGFKDLEDWTVKS